MNNILQDYTEMCQDAKDIIQKMLENRMRDYTKKVWGQERLQCLKKREEIE